MAESQVTQSGISAGPSTDRFNTPVYDPSFNVGNLVEASFKSLTQTIDQAVKRLDDLAIERQKRQDDLRVASAAHVDAILTLTSGYEEKLRLKESSRLDAIRAVDVQAVAEASRVATSTASLLATQLAAASNDQRIALANLSTTLTEMITTTVAPLRLAIESLREAQYQQQGNKAGQVESKVDTRGNQQLTLQTLFLIVAFLGLAITFAAYITTHR